MTAVVLFDFGNVVATWDAGPRVAGYARQSGLDADEVLNRLSTDDFWINTDRGHYTAAQMETRISELLGCSFSREELLRLQAIAFELRPDVIELAKNVASSSTVGILTNNAPLLHDAVPVHFPELPAVFDPIFYSFQFGQVKPEADLFHGVQRTLGVSGSEIVFIDDTEGHVAAASAIGWDGIHYLSPPQLRRDLEKRGLIV